MSLPGLTRVNGSPIKSKIKSKFLAMVSKHSKPWILSTTLAPLPITSSSLPTHPTPQTTIINSVHAFTLASVSHWSGLPVFFTHKTALYQLRSIKILLPPWNSMPLHPYLANAPAQQNINPESMPQSPFLTPKASELHTTEENRRISAQLQIHDHHPKLGFHHCSDTCVLNF